jgi:hypothetical protein
MAVQTRGPSQEQILSELDSFAIEAESNPFLTQVVEPKNPFFSPSGIGQDNPFGSKEVSQ